MSQPPAKSRRRRIATALVWTAALLLLTNLFWSLWGALDVDHPTSLDRTDRRAAAEFFNGRGVFVREQSLRTRTIYEVRKATSAQIAQAYPGENLLPFDAVAPRWIRRRFSESSLADDPDWSARGSYESVGWPVRLLWCGSESRSGARAPVPYSGISVREPKQANGRLDGITPIRPILAGQLFYGGLILALVILLPIAQRRIGAWLAACGCSREERRAAIRQFLVDARRGRWISRRNAVKMSALLMIGLIINLAVAWACAAWVEPTGMGSMARLTPISEGLYLGESRIERFGRSLIFRASTREYTYVTEMFGETPQSAVWDFNEMSHAEIQAGWPLRAWSCRNDAYLEMTTFHGVLSTVKPGAYPTSGGFDLPPFRGVGSARGWRALPYQPLWLGAVINTLFYAALIWLVAIMARTVLRMQRTRRGACPACAYPIGTSPVCTECGAALPLRAVPQDEL